MKETYLEILRIVEEVTDVSASEMLTSNCEEHVDARHILVYVLGNRGFSDTKIAAAKLSNSYNVWASRTNSLKKTQSMPFKKVFVIWALECRQVSTVPIRVLKEVSRKLVTTLRNKLATSLLPATLIPSVLSTL